MYDMDVVVQENVYNSVMTSVESLDFNTRAEAERSMDVLAEKIQQHYATLAPYMSEWVLRKGRAGLPTAPLHYTETLAGDVLRIRKDTRHIEGPKGEHTIDFHGFPNSPYVGLIENEYIPKGQPRPFFTPAVDEWAGIVVKDAEAIAQGTAALPDKPERAPGVYTTTTGVSRGFHMIPRWAFWVIPTTSMFLYMGMYSDITSAMHGSFLKPGAARSWVVAYFQGQVLITKKTMRRAFRRQLWKK